MLRIFELDHFASIDVDEMIVAPVLRWLIARAAATEITPLEDPFLLQQTNGAVDGRDGNMGIEAGRTAIQLLDIGVVRGFGKHPSDYPALPGHFQASFDAQAFDARFHRFPGSFPQPA